MTSNHNKPTRSEQREIARAKAREVREQQQKGARRKKLGIQVGLGAVVLGIATAIVFAVTSGTNSNGNNTGAMPVNFSFNDGIKIGANLEVFTPTSTPTPGPSAAPAPVPNIAIYLDYQCPVCQAFEVPNKSQIENWVKTGQVTLEVHPLSFLDTRASLNEYSSRAANAAICVAEKSPNNFFAYNSWLFENQPAEGTYGPENSALIDGAKKLGVKNFEQISKCINEKSYANWISTTTTKALSENVPGTKLKVEGTPFILVNGQPYTWKTGEELINPARFAQFKDSVVNN